MATMKRSDYMKFRAVGRAATSQSNYASTLVKKQQAAEDDYYDYAYSNGSITADQYISNLNQRKARVGLTPLQSQNLAQKIQQTQEAYQDSLISTAYKSGATYNGEIINTQYMYDREKKKLDAMTPGSDAYNKQTALVQSYSDKIISEKDASEKSTRKQYRIDESLKISNMRQETSQELTAKANMYEKLEAMARADGDTQDATTLETNKNNLRQAASKAAVNERIQDVVVANSTPVAPMSKDLTPGTVNSANAGIVGNQPSGNNAVNPTAPTEQPTEPNSGEPEMVTYGGVQMAKNVYDELVNSTEIQNFLTRNAKDIRKINGETGKNNGLNAAIASQENLVNVYKTELDNASADNKDTLLKGYNDAVERYNSLVQQRDDVISIVEERGGQFGELVAKKAASVMKNQDLAFERELDAAIKKTQEDFSRGTLPLDKYIEDMYNNLTAGSTRFGLQTKLYEQVNDAVGMSSSTEKASSYNDTLNYVNSEIIPNKDSLRVVQVDETNNDKINLAKGIPGVRKGEFIIENPTAGAVDQTEATAKLAEWDKSHIQLKGVWFPVRYNFDSVPKDFTSEETKKKYAEENNLFVYKKISDGKEENVPVKAVDYGNGLSKYIPEVDVNKYVKSGSFKQDGTKIVNLGGMTDSKFNLLGSIGEEIKKNVANPGDMLENVKQNLKGGAGFLAKGFNAMMNNSAPVVFNNWLDSKTKKTETKNQSFNAPAFSLAKPVYAADNPPASNGAYPIASMGNGQIKYSDGTVRKADVEVPTIGTGTIADIINKAAEKYAPGDAEFKKILHAIALAESGGNPNAVGDGGVSIGLFQNNMAGGRGSGHSKANLLNPEYNANLSAADLVKYYKKGVSQGLSGSNLVAYVSKYGQRPAAGLEANAAKNYGNFVGTSTSKAINEPSVANQVKAVSQNSQKSAIPAIVKPVYAAEPVTTPGQMQSVPNQNLQSKNSDAVAPWVNSSQQNSSPAPVSTPKVSQPVSTPTNFTPASPIKLPLSTYGVGSNTPAKSTPAPKPAPVSKPTPAPQQNNFISQAKSAVSNTVSSIANVLKKLKFW